MKPPPGMGKSNQRRFVIGTNAFLLDGWRFQICCGNPRGARAELGLLDESGRLLSHEDWMIAYGGSEERSQEDGSAENAIDGQTANFWHTEWSAAQPNHPPQLVLDLGKSQVISGTRCVPRRSAGGGRIEDYSISVGDGLIYSK